MKDIRWLINRLRAMNARELVWRVQQKLVQKQEYKLFYSVNLPVTDNPLPKHLKSLKAYATKIPLNTQNKSFSIFEKLDIFGTYDYQENKKKWNAGFQTDNVWPEKVYSPDISISQREDIGDIRTNWELNRHFQFCCIAKNFYVTGKMEYIDEFIEIFEDWNVHNLFLHGAEWTSAMEVGIRINSWIYAYVFLFYGIRKYKVEILHILDKLLHGILVMTDYVVKHRARFSSANNHLIVEMYAVGMSGFLFDKKDWIDLSIKTLTEELPKQNFEDGVNKEMSLHYQTFVMEAYGLLYLVMNKNKYDVPDSWGKYLTAMSKYVADCCGDYGEVVVFGDNDEGKILDLQGKIEDHYRYVLQLMGVVLDERYTEYPLVENVCWLTSFDERNAYRTKRLYTSGLVSHYKTGGYTILRSKDRRILMGIDHAVLGFGSIAAHGHADALSFQMFIEGKPFLVDSGTYNYHVPKEVRDILRESKAHNTVTIKDSDQAEMLGAFLWGRRYKTYPVKIEMNDKFVEIVSKISYGGVTHERQVKYNYTDALEIEDLVIGGGEAFVTLNFSNYVQPCKVKEGILCSMALISSNIEMEIRPFIFSERYDYFCHSLQAVMPLVDGKAFIRIEIK